MGNLLATLLQLEPRQFTVIPEGHCWSSRPVPEAEDCTVVHSAPMRSNDVDIVKLIILEPTSMDVAMFDKV